MSKGGEASRSNRGSPSDGGRKLLSSVAVAMGLVLIVMPLVDFMIVVWPLRPGVMPWRMGFVGVLSGTLMLPALGLGLICMAIAAQQGSLALRICSALGLTGAVACVGIALMFVFDSLQVRVDLAESVIPAFDGSTVKVVFNFGVLFLFFLWIGWRSGGLGRQRRSKAAADSEAPLIVTPKTD